MPIKDINEFEFKDLEEVPAEELLADASKLSQEMITGEIPKDVQEQLETITAEKGIKAGIGQGEAQRNLVARDMAMTSFDIASRGASLATGVADTQAKYEALREQRYEFNRKQIDAMKQTDIKESTLALGAHQLIASNEQFSMELANSLILNNSRNEIAGVQQNIDTLLGTETDAAYFEAQNKELLKLIDKYTEV